MGNRDNLRKSPRTPEEILATGAAWISEIELDYLVKRLAAAEQKLGWSEATIEALQATIEGLGQERDRLKAENERLLRCLADYPAGNQTEPDAKAALREVEGE